MYFKEILTDQVPGHYILGTDVHGSVLAHSYDNVDPISAFIVELLIRSAKTITGLADSLTKDSSFNTL